MENGKAEDVVFPVLVFRSFMKCWRRLPSVCVADHTASSVARPNGTKTYPLPTALEGHCLALLVAGCFLLAS